MKAYVKWPKTELYAGPYFALENLNKEGEIVVESFPECAAFVPYSACITDEDWTLWEGGECPVEPGTRVEYLLQAGHEDCQLAEELAWKIEGELSDIIAYRVVEPAQVPLSTILDPTLWWLSGSGEWIQVHGYRPGKPGWELRLSGGRVAPCRDWFTNRRHLTAAELAEETEAHRE